MAGSPQEFLAQLRGRGETGEYQRVVDGDGGQGQHAQFDRVVDGLQHVDLPPFHAFDGRRGGGLKGLLRRGALVAARHIEQLDLHASYSWLASTRSRAARIGHSSTASVPSGQSAISWSSAADIACIARILAASRSFLATARCLT